MMRSVILAGSMAMLASGTSAEPLVDVVRELRNAATALERAADVLEQLDQTSVSTVEPPSVARTATLTPPLTGAERDGFRLAIAGCWALDPGSEAAHITVTVSFELDRQGRVQDDVRLVTAAGGSNDAIEDAFQAAKSAILRCQSNGGYQLPADKYEQWREVEMTFDPSGMRMR